MQQEKSASHITYALEIAKRDLRACYRKHGIIAGLDHFDDYWARDSFFASWGAVAVGDTDIAKKNLEMFLTHQRQDGLIPRRFNRSGGITLKYITGIRIPVREPKPVYRGRYPHPNTDPNALVVIASEKYFELTQDILWLEGNIAKIWLALLWLKAQDTDHDGLIEEQPFSSWMDTIKKRGQVFYTNVLALAALDAGVRLAEVLNTTLPPELKSWREKLKTAIQTFWKGQYFIDWIYKERRFDYFSTDGNLLAIVFGITPPAYSERIFEYMRRCYGSAPEPPPTNFPFYNRSDLALSHRLLGLTGYHNVYSRWLWLAALDMVARFRNGRQEEAMKEMGTISKWILRHRHVYEIFQSDGTPFHSWFFSSEVPFAWSAGMLLWAAKEMGLLPTS